MYCQLRKFVLENGITMVSYKTGTECVDWPQLYHLYSHVELVDSLGKRSEFNKIKSAFINSLKVVTAWKADKLVGAGRLISDGICYGTIFDLGVLPEYQKQGIGKGMMNELLRNNEHLYVYLTSTFGNEEFYREFGFKPHKTAFLKYPFESEYLED